MNAMLLYFGQVSLLIGILYIVYRALFARDSFHHLKRFVLLFGLGVCFALPWCRITIDRPVRAEVVDPPLLLTAGRTTAQQGRAVVAALSRDEPRNGWAWLGVVYGVGVAAVAGYRLVGLLRVRGLIRRMVGRSIYQGVDVLYVAEPVGAFSFGRRIVVGQGDTPPPELILRHEYQHIVQRHAWDLVAIHWAAILLWFNPFIWLLWRELVLVHEFSADRGVLNSGIDAKQYQYLLILKCVGPVGFIPVVHHFSQSDLQQRIKTMKKRSSKWAVLKLAVLLPVVAGGLVAFAHTNYVPLSAADVKQELVYTQPYEGRVVAEFGERIDPQTQRKTIHSGIDVVVTCDTVRAPYDGVVVLVQYSKEAKGNALTLVHADGLKTTYAHLKAFLIPKGGRVESGQPIAIAGNTGKSTNKHLHLECRVSGQLVDPQTVLPLNK